MMKKIMIIVFLLIFPAWITKTMAQADEIAQLVLNVEKLAQLKSILSDLKKGYQIVDEGYGKIKDISKGNFNIHDQFLTGLLNVSPQVKNYYKVGRIINNQLRLIREYKAALSRFRKAGCFNAGELEYFAGVYGRLTSESMRSLDDLANVVTASKLRMSDDERLQAIDRIDDDMADKIKFLGKFNSSTSILMIRRQAELREIRTLREINGILP